ncbi:MAG: DUF2125 domain-containing protein [Alphaproteobacteria bacterium]|nr:DUF2125 domain-containing protein [Alphaproteobacteria bacterium]
MRSFRLVSLVVIALGVMAVGAIAPLWYGAARALEAGIRTWAETPRDAVSIEIGRVAVSGFPFALDATITSFAIASADLGARYYAEHVRVSRGLMDRDATFEMVAPQQITLASGTAFDIDADRFAGTVRTPQDGSPARGFTLSAAGVRVRWQGLALASAQRLSVQELAPDGSSAIPTSSRAELRIVGLNVPAQRRGPFGDTLAELSANLELEGALESSTLGRSIPAWQRAGGRLYVSDAVVRWGTLDAGRIGGALRLDTMLRPTGRLSITFRDPARTFEALAAADWVDPKTRTELMNGVGYDPNRVAVLPYCLSFLDGWIVLDDIEQDQTAPIRLWRVPSLVSRRAVEDR